MFFIILFDINESLKTIKSSVKQIWLMPIPIHGTPRIINADSYIIKKEPNFNILCIK